MAMMTSLTFREIFISDLTSSLLLLLFNVDFISQKIVSFASNLMGCDCKVPNRDLYPKHTQDRHFVNSVSFYSISKLIATIVNDCPETSIETDGTTTIETTK